MGEKDEDDEVRKALDAANILMYQQRADAAYLLLDQMNKLLDKNAEEAKKKQDEKKGNKK